MIWNNPERVPEELKGKEFWAYRIDDDGQLIIPITLGFIERVQRCSDESCNIDFVSCDYQYRMLLMDCVISDNYYELRSDFVRFAKEKIFLMELKSRALKSEILKL